MKVSKTMCNLILALGLSASHSVYAGLISGTDAPIALGEVSYQSFVLAAADTVTLTATVKNFGTDADADTINFFLFEGLFGSLGAVLDSTSPVTNFNSDIASITESTTLLAGTYTYALGTNQLTEIEARTGIASTPVINGVLYDFSISSDSDLSRPSSVPAPGTVALLGFGLAALGWKRRKAA